MTSPKMIAKITAKTINESLNYSPKHDILKNGPVKPLATTTAPKMGTAGYSIIVTVTDLMMKLASTMAKLLLQSQLGKQYLFKD